MGCVVEVEIDELYILRYLGWKEPFWKEFDGFITKSRLQTPKEGKLVKEFRWEKGKMATEIVQILNCFSLKWVSTYQPSKSSFLQVNLNFELK